MNFHQHNETRILQSLGYKRIYMFYMGKSKYNSSLFGWNGHVKNGSTLGSTEGMKVKFYLLMSLKYLNHLEILTRISKGLPSDLLRVSNSFFIVLLKEFPRDFYRNSC